MIKTFQAFRRHLSKTAMALTIFLAAIVLQRNSAQAQIYEPEGLNMPGAWNAWANPPTNLVLASSTQVPGGGVIKIASGTPRWQTIFSVAASGGNLIGGTYEWLFTSGPATNYYQNKWATVAVTMNTLQLYSLGGATNNSITLADGKWYTMNWEDLGYMDTRAIFMETSAMPVSIEAVSVPATVLANAVASIFVGLSGPKCPEENVFLRYTIDGWATSAVVPVIIDMTGAQGTADIPGQVAGTVVSYYIFTTTLSAVTADFDLVTIRFQNNGGANFTYTVTSPPPAITFANLQSPGQGQIIPHEDFEVFGQAYIEGLTGLPVPAAGLLAWVGYNTVDTDPSTWTLWLNADYNAPAGNNDEFKANLGIALTFPGTYYYATRFQLNADPFVYGGFSATGGGFWDGVTNVSGVLDVMVGMPEGRDDGIRVYPNPVKDFLNLDLPVDVTLSISNNLGRILIQQEAPAGKHQVDLSNLPGGVYHLLIISGERTIHQSVVRQ